MNRRDQLEKDPKNHSSSLSGLYFGGLKASNIWNQCMPCFRRVPHVIFHLAPPRCVFKNDCFFLTFLFFIFSVLVLIFLSFTALPAPFLCCGGKSHTHNWAECFVFPRFRQEGPPLDVQSLDSERISLLSLAGLDENGFANIHYAVFRGSIAEIAR